MTLWNIIRDFFVKYVFGGMATGGEYYNNNLFGNGYFMLPDGSLDDVVGVNANEVFIFEYIDLGNYTVKISLADWLSTTATIITLVGLFIAITLLIISLFKWIVRLVSLRG